jgi:hypothetical protein
VKHLKVDFSLRGRCATVLVAYVRIAPVELAVQIIKEFLIPGSAWFLIIAATFAAFSSSDRSGSGCGRRPLIGLVVGLGHQRARRRLRTQVRTGSRVRSAIELTQEPCRSLSWEMGSAATRRLAGGLNYLSVIGHEHAVRSNDSDCSASMVMSGSPFDGGSV